MIGGALTDVHESAVDKFILKEAKWFTANYDEVKSVLGLVKEQYDTFLDKSKELRDINKSKFSLDAMTEEFSKIISPYIQKPEKVAMNLPKLTKLK
jgi:hypothetical protein